MAKRTTNYEDRLFGKFLFDNIITEIDLGEVADYVSTHMRVEDVYDKDDLIEWATTGLDPEDVFSADRLSEWAQSNGFVAEDDFSTP